MLKYIYQKVEYYPMLNEIRAKIDEFTALDEQARLAWCRNYLETM